MTMQYIFHKNYAEIDELVIKNCSAGRHTRCDVTTNALFKGVYMKINTFNKFFDLILNNHSRIHEYH